MLDFDKWFKRLVQAYKGNPAGAALLTQQARWYGMLPQDIERAKVLAYTQAWKEVRLEKESSR